MAIKYYINAAVSEFEGNDGKSKRRYQTKIGIATIELPDNVDPLSVASVEWVANLLPSGIKVCDMTIRGQKIILAVAMGPTRPRGGRKRRIRVLKPGALPVGSEA